MPVSTDHVSSATMVTLLDTSNGFEVLVDEQSSTLQGLDEHTTLGALPIFLMDSIVHGMECKRLEHG